MNIDKEVEKYNAKKSKLLTNLVGRLVNYRDSKWRAVSNIDKATADLVSQKAENLDQIEVVNDKLKELK